MSSSGFLGLQEGTENDPVNIPLDSIVLVNYFVSNHLGKYTVLKVNLASVDSFDPAAYVIQMTNAIAETFKMHEEILKEIVTDQNQVAAYLSNASLPFLVGLLHLRNEKWRRREKIQKKGADIVIILDEHDVGFNNAIIRYNSTDEEEFMKLTATTTAYPQFGEIHSCVTM
uniref:Uncharacterized protein n=1 Tax=Ditylenchus dipsaci TaxID=166011 RepID=A0A915E4P4_9BILA